MRNVLVLLLALVCFAAVEGVDLEVEIRDERRLNCPVYVAVYRDPRSWLGEKPFRYERGEMKAGLGRAVVPKLPEGKYAMLAYCDKNGNGKLDENLLGVPKEPYGFSNGKAGKYELSFAEAAFEVGANGTGRKQEIVLVLP
jgi:uncharacterized protein (DUF2141 family)